MRLNRREFAWASTWGLWAGGLSATQAKLLQAFAEEASPVSFPFEIETVARILERTPRAKCLETMIRLIKQGIGYRQFLGGLFLAGIRNVNPRPPGFQIALRAGHECRPSIQSGCRTGGPVSPPRLGSRLLQKVSGRRCCSGRLPVAGLLCRSPLRGTSLGPVSCGNAPLGLKPGRIRHDHTGSTIGVPKRSLRGFGCTGHATTATSGTKPFWSPMPHAPWKPLAGHVRTIWRSVVSSLLDFGPTQVVNLYGLDDQCFPAFFNWPANK